jgi:nicotinamidase-related amidase
MTDLRLGSAVHVAVDMQLPFAEPRPWGVPLLEAQGADTLMLSGVETDVYVPATVMSATDLGFHVVLAADALCSASDVTHDALPVRCRRHFSRQVTTATTDEILQLWNRHRSLWWPAT